MVVGNESGERNRCYAIAGGRVTNFKNMFSAKSVDAIK